MWITALKGLLTERVAILLALVALVVMVTATGKAIYQKGHDEGYNAAQVEKLTAYNSNLVTVIESDRLKISEYVSQVQAGFTKIDTFYNTRIKHLTNEKDAQAAGDIEVSRINYELKNAKTDGCSNGGFDPDHFRLFIDGINIVKPPAGYSPIDPATSGTGTAGNSARFINSMLF